MSPMEYKGIQRNTKDTSDGIHTKETTGIQTKEQKRSHAMESNGIQAKYYTQMETK